ncbi:MAG: hypothetical protein HY809_08855 [Nitrospirae bacterium]|nr:hypothetical protein [Nitrospirota bacterium]
MKAHLCRGRLSLAIILASLAISVSLLMKIAVSHEHSLDGLRGEPFSAPSYVQPMEPGWENQPIIYEASVGSADIAVTLDQQMFTAFKPLIQNYALQHGLKIAINEGTCGITSGMLSDKSIDIGGFCCPPGKTDRLPGLSFHTVGIASIALIVHPENPAEEISIDEARLVFMGDIKRWPDLSNYDSEKQFDVAVKPVGRLHCKIRPGHWRLLLANDDLFAPNLLEVGAIPDMIAQVSSEKGAIGYETLWMAYYFKDRGNVKALKINGYDPGDASAVISGKYPIYRTYNLTTWSGKDVEKKHARELVEYLMTAVDKLEGKYNFIPVSRLREAGWKFKGDELVGEPDGQ